jgi:hypothetical protein
MPLQRTLSFVNICDENSPPTPGPPAISRRQTGSSSGSLFNSPSGSSPAANQSSKPPGATPYRRSLQYYKEQRQIEKVRCQIERAQRNKGVVESLAMDGSPSMPSYALHSPVTPSGTYMVRNEGAVGSPPICSSPSTLSYELHSPVQPSGTYMVKPPPTTKSPLRQSSPLGPRRHSLPGRPVFPPSSGRKPDLYRKVLKKSACQIKMGIHRTGKKLAGGVDKVV